MIIFSYVNRSYVIRPSIGTPSFDLIEEDAEVPIKNNNKNSRNEILLNIDGALHSLFQTQNLGAG